VPDVRRLYVKVEYGDKDITKQVEPYLLSLEYSDDLDGKKPDRVVVRLADGERRFQGELYPIKGSAVCFEFGYDEDTAFKSGRGYMIDQIKVAGGANGDTVEWTALANIPSGSIHTRRCKVWEDVTLEDLTKEIAGRHKLEAIYEGPAITLKRVVQRRDTDFKLLHDLAKKYELHCSLKAGTQKGGNTTLVVADPKSTSAKPPIYRIKRGDCTEFTFTDFAPLHTKGRYACWFDPVAKKLVTAEAAKEAATADDGLTGGTADTLEGKGQEDRAIVREAMQLYAGQPTKDPERKAEMTLEGNPKLIAGVTVELPAEEWGNNAGIWTVLQSKHTLNADGGYRTVATLGK